jgi:UPF0755 protein
MKAIRAVRNFALLAVMAGGFTVYRLGSPYQGFEKETFVDVPRGTSTGAIAGLLADAGVVRSRWDFLAARVAARGRKLQAGEYRFDHAATPMEVYARVARGDIFYIQLVATEGQNMFDIAASAEKLGLFPAAEFLAAARNPRPIRDLDPKAPTLEGYLFPNTYRVGRHTTPEQLCGMMTARFREVWRGLRTDADVHEVVTLASMVEKEAKLEDERPLIAAVYANRLRIGMKLDCDPTTIYAALMEGAYRGAIYQSDLARDNPYNTYKRAGLPPGPIANPGLASLTAAIAPAASKDLYFVARPDGSGAHQFSADLAAHEKAATEYRRGKRRKK